MTRPGAAGSELDRDLSQLEERLAALVAHAQSLRTANDALKRDLAAAQERNRSLAERLDSAAQRLDALLARLPRLAR
jgi:cell division protein ZapB